VSVESARASGGGGLMTEPKSERVYLWGNNTKRATLKGRKCIVIAYGRRNSALVEFENGQREIISRRAISPAR